MQQDYILHFAGAVLIDAQHYLVHLLFNMRASAEFFFTKTRASLRSEIVSHTIAHASFHSAGDGASPLNKSLSAAGGSCSGAETAERLAAWKP